MEFPKKVVNDIQQLMGEADLHELYMFGGAVLDTLLNKNAQVNDYDVCVKDETMFYKTLSNLKKQSQVSDVMRTHNIYAVIKHPQLGQIDFSCMDPEDNGILNIEKIYARFNLTQNGLTYQIVDKYDAIEGMKQGKIRLTALPEKEGAYNILRRFLATAGKYDIDIRPNGINQPFINQMNDAFSKNYPYVAQDRVRCLSRFGASLKRSKNRPEFIKNLYAQKIFEQPFPDIHKLLGNPEFQNDEKLKTATSQKELLWLMLRNTKGEARDDLVDTLLLLSKREKARQDTGVNEVVTQLSHEKTSPERLNKKVINPLYAFIMNKQNKEK